MRGQIQLAGTGNSAIGVVHARSVDRVLLCAFDQTTLIVQVGGINSDRIGRYGALLVIEYAHAKVGSVATEHPFGTVVQRGRLNRNSAGFAPDLPALIAEVLIQGEVGLILCPCFALVIVQTVGRDAQVLSLQIALYAADISAVERNGLIALNSPTVVVQIARLQAEVLQRVPLALCCRDSPFSP